jgi:4-hydroxy-2-oxoheptanedioate aldolase
MTGFPSNNSTHGETMDIKNKRDFLKGFGMVSAGVVAAGDALAQGRGRADVPNEGGYPPGVPKATGRSMLDSPHYIGEASKGYGFKANWARTLPMVPTVDPNYKPRRINKAIELWEDNQVVAYAEYGASGAPDCYEEGKRMAKTFCDAINFEMENDSFNFDSLRNFMQGLVDGGPTPSGHRTPMVFVTLPAWGYDGPSMRANIWQVAQAMAAGAHGCLICETESAEATEIAVAGARYKWTWPGVQQLPLEGCRGAGSEAFASHIWGLSGAEYRRVADTWPHNPKGEVTMGVKLENRRSAQVCEEVLSVPGLAFCEPGPSDNGLSHLGWDAVREDITPAQRAALPGTRRLADDLERIRLAAKANNVRWLGGGPPGATPQEEIDQGRRMGPAGPEARVQADRLYTKRKMPY